MLGEDLPQAYLDMLKVVNGFEFNGTFYGIDEELLDYKPKQEINGVLDLNEIWHENEWPEGYIFIGDDSISWYVFFSKKGEYYVLDRPSGDIVETYSSFEEIFESLLSTCLL